jgi:hypothetical protein
MIFPPKTKILYIFQEIPNANIDMNVFSTDILASMQ